MNEGIPTQAIKQVRIEQLPSPSDSEDDDNPFIGPFRVFPGRLSVCRTFGDCEAKMKALGGLPSVVICDPEVLKFEDGTNKIDFIIIGSDGLFDKLKND